MNLSPSFQTAFSRLYAGYARHRKPMHMHIPTLKHYLIRLQIEGSAHIVMGDQYLSMSPGHLLMLMPGESYDLRIGYKNPATFEPHAKIHSFDYYLIINGPWLDAWWDKYQPASLSAHALDDRMLTLWREIMQEQRLQEMHMNDIVMHLTFALFQMFDRKLKLQDIENIDIRTTRLAHQMKQYIDRNLIESFTVNDVAQSVELSASRAAHIFKAEFQQSIMDYAIDARISLACERIQHEYMSMEQISELCGFQSYTYFHRTFKNRMGLSPRQFRDQRQLQGEIQ